MNETLLPRSENIQDLYFLYLFLTENSEQHKERLLGVVTFVYFFRRVLSETYSGIITTNIEQYI